MADTSRAPADSPANHESATDQACAGATPGLVDTRHSFVIDGLKLGPDGRTSMAILNTDCSGIPGTRPRVCPRSAPRLPNELMPSLVPRFRELCLISPDETLLWVGRQLDVDTLCVYRHGCSCFDDEPPPATPPPACDWRGTPLAEEIFDLISGIVFYAVHPPSRSAPGRADAQCAIPADDEWSITADDARAAQDRAIADEARVDGEYRARFEAERADRDASASRLIELTADPGFPVPPGVTPARYKFELRKSVNACRAFGPAPTTDVDHLLEVQSDLRALLPQGIAGTTPAGESNQVPGGVNPADDTPERAEGEISADAFTALREFARTRLKGKQRAVVETLCDSNGRLSIVDLALVDGLDWEEPFVKFKSTQDKLNPKLKRQGFKLERRDNAATLLKIEGAKEAPKSAL